MKGQLNTFFPLSVYSSMAGLEPTLRQDMVRDVDEAVKATGYSDDVSSWTGDVNGYHCLHNNPLYAPLISAVREALIEYCTAIGITPGQYDYYFTRSWAVKQTKGRTVEYHRHDCSHISVVYYPEVPKGSGAFHLATDNHQNELFSGLFRPEQYSQRMVSLSNPHSASETALNVADDLMLIFPSKTGHRTAPNKSESPRYSITMDILMTLKSADKHEFGLPPVENWKQIQG
jgi:hypothetical protein